MQLDRVAGLRLIIVDDDAEMRHLLRALVNELGAEVLAEADNGQIAIEQVELHDPQLILLDISMPVMGGFPAARYLHEHIPELKIILMSQYQQKEYADEALQAGARAYLVKKSAAYELGPAMDAVLQGQTFLSASIR